MTPQVGISTCVLTGLSQYGISVLVSDTDPDTASETGASTSVECRYAKKLMSSSCTWQIGLPLETSRYWRSSIVLSNTALNRVIVDEQVSDHNNHFH